MAELNDRQRKLAFAGIVVALAFVGIYLTLPSSGGSSTPDRHTSALPNAGSSTEVPDAPTSTPSGIASSISPGTFNIYNLLPFTQTDFADAATTGQRFMVDYETYAWNENPQAYVQRLEQLAVSDLANQIAQSGPTPAIQQQRTQTHEVARGTASVDAVSGFGQTSITFLITGHQQVGNSNGTSQHDQQFSITVVKSGTAWEVYAYQPASAGQAGDTGQGQG